MPRKKKPITSATILDQKAEESPEPDPEALFEPPVDPLAQYEPADRHWRRAAQAVEAWHQLFGMSLDLERTARHIAMLEATGAVNKSIAEFEREIGM